MNGTVLFLFCVQLLHSYVLFCMIQFESDLFYIFQFQARLKLLLNYTMMHITQWRPRNGLETWPQTSLETTQLWTQTTSTLYLITGLLARKANKILPRPFLPEKRPLKWRPHLHYTLPTSLMSITSLIFLVFWANVLHFLMSMFHVSS